ncbi:MAG: hypothetical protein OZ930_08210 [Ignavibacteria bacterium]|nr:hypothetical protein [Ignavibacteria bacterium]
MKKNNIDQSVFKPMEHRASDKANTVFLKLYAKLNKPKNPFDDIRSYTSPSMRENKPGPDYA